MNPVWMNLDLSVDLDSSMNKVWMNLDLNVDLDSSMNKVWMKLDLSIDLDGSMNKVSGHTHPFTHAEPCLDEAGPQHRSRQLYE